MTAITESQIALFISFLERLSREDRADIFRMFTDRFCPKCGWDHRQSLPSFDVRAGLLTVGVCRAHLG